MDKNTLHKKTGEPGFPPEYLQYTSELQALAIQSQQGDKKQHVALLTKISPMLRAIVKRNWWGDSFSHEDIVQDILLVIHNKMHTYDPSMPIMPWIRAIAHYRILDYVRQHKRKHSLVDTIDDGNVTFDPVDTDKSFEKIENMDFVIHALKTLPQQQSLVVYMLKVQGLSIVEVSKKTGKSISAVKVTAHRAYKQLARYARDQLR